MFLVCHGDSDESLGAMRKNRGGVASSKGQEVMRDMLYSSLCVCVLAYYLKTNTVNSRTHSGAQKEPIKLWSRSE